MVTIPDHIQADPDLAEIWHQVVPENNRFKAEQLPTLELLVFWHGVAKAAMEAVRRGDKWVVVKAVGYSGIEVNGQRVPVSGKNPALTVLKEATMMIKQLTEALDITSNTANTAAASGNGKVLQLVLGDRAKKEKKANGA